MAIFKKKSASNGRQRRLAHDAEKPAAPTLSYYSRRTAEDGNTGRSQLLSKSRPAVGKAARFWGQRLGLLILLLVILASVISVMSVSNNSQIITVDTNNEAFFLHTQDEYQSAANKLLARSIWNKNKVTIDTGKVEREMQRQFPELSHVSVTLPLLGHRPVVYIQAAQPAVILTAGDYSFVLDSNGRALLKSPSAADFNHLNLPVVVDQSGIDPQVGRVALAASSVEFIQTVVAQLKEKNQTIATLKLPAGTSQLDVQVRDQKYFIKFNLQSEDARRQVGTYLATQEWLKANRQTPSQYIDVRVEGRSYFK